jgi:predicted dehydrogenase/MoaA/NifB/PqqE/SkfB family radical SAM enzyme
MSAARRRIVTVTLRQRCQLSCTVCDCRAPAAPADDRGVPRLVYEGGTRLVLRGEAGQSPALLPAISAARASGFGEIVVRTNGLSFLDPGRARALARHGVTEVVVPLFAPRSGVHDRIAGRAGALVSAVRAMRELASAGLAVSVEIPLLPPRLGALAETVELASRSVSSLRSVRFYVPSAAQPAVLSLPPWEEIAPGLSRAIRLARDRGAKVTIEETDGIPLCALGHDPAHGQDYRFDPRRAAGVLPGRVHPLPCERCTVRRHCAGVPEAYAASNGGASLRPFVSRPRTLLAQRTSAVRVWTDAEREAAKRARLLVLRPTVHCNQDCLFCSANETSHNVVEDPGEMLRKIARAARRGVDYLAFGGGEPTLSRALPSYVAAARRLGIPQIEVVTNGILLANPARVDELVSAGLTRAFVSLHAHDEQLSSRMTRKSGDFDRTVRSIDLLLARGVVTRLNHVVNATNYRYLPAFARFLADRWQRRAELSLAFVTPQFKALEHDDLVPSMTEVRPYLRRAMWILLDRGVTFEVGSRQGIPPCVLGSYERFSDVMSLADQARAEDTPQKVKRPECSSCKWDPYCTGVFRSYAAKYGLEELSPVPSAGSSARPELLPLPDGSEDGALEEPPPLARTRLPMVADGKPGREALSEVRVALLGSGGRARRLAEALRHVRGATLVGVASPHLLDREDDPFEARHFSDERALFEVTRPDAVIVASSTRSHHGLALACVARKIPVLVEKPLASTRAEAEELARAARTSPVIPAHQMLFSPGILALFQELDRGAPGKRAHIQLRFAFPPGSSGWQPGWNPVSLAELLYHAAYMLLAAGGPAELVRVDAQGDLRPEWIRVETRSADGTPATTLLNFDAAAESVDLFVHGLDGHLVGCSRSAEGEELVRNGPGGARTSSVRGPGDAVGLLDAFVRSVRGEPPPVLPEDALAVMDIVRAVLDRLEGRLVSKTAPKHASSPALR